MGVLSRDRAPPSPDYFVGAQHDRFGDGDAEQPRRLEIDDERELGRLLEGQAARLDAFEDLVDVQRRVTGFRAKPYVWHRARITPHAQDWRQRSHIAELQKNTEVVGMLSGFCITPPNLQDVRAQRTVSSERLDVKHKQGRGGSSG